MTVEFVGSLDRVPAAEWRRLSERAGHVFATREWHVTWWRHHGGGSGRPVIGLVSQGDSLVAIVPLYVWRSLGLPVLRFIGHGLSDQLGPISAPLSDPTTRPAVARAIAALPLRRYLLLAEQVAADQEFGVLTGARPLYREDNPTLLFDCDTWDEFLGLRSSNFRQQVRRFPRRLADRGVVSYRLAADPTTLQRDLDTLFRLHRARWGGADTPFVLAAAFHRDFAACALEQGWLRLWFLEVDGRPVAALYGFRYAGTESAYQSGRDPAFRDNPLGFILLAHAVREALVDGMREYRLLRGDEQYKARFATNDSGLETFGLPRGVAARSLLAIAVASQGRSLGLRRRILDRL